MDQLLLRIMGVLVWWISLRIPETFASTPKPVAIAPNSVEVTHFNSSQSVTYEVTNIPSNVSFVVFQAQTQHTNLTVSLTENWTYGKSESGSHIGVVKTLTKTQTSATFYVNTSIIENEAQVVILATTYNTTFPIPGGCNIEFPLEDDPNIRTYYTADETVLQFEYASYNTERNKRSLSCENQDDQNNLSYDVYVYYIPENDVSEETYISKIQQMLTVEGITAYGTKIRTYEYNKGITNMSVPSFLGQGAIYSVIVKQTGVNANIQTAAYVSAATYTCTFDPKGSGQYCYDLGDMQTQIACSVLGVFGLFLCFFGHRYFKFEMFVFGFLAFGLITYIILGRFSTWNATVLMSGSFAGALIGGMLWLVFWWHVGVPVLSVLLGGLCCGFLFTATAFNLTPLGTLTVFTSAFNFGMAYTCGVLVLPVILLAFTRTLSIISCALIGSYAAILIPSVWIGGTLQYIVINIYRKCTIPDFITAVLIVPIHWQETIMIVAWATLFFGGIAFQFYREWNRPKFPPCPKRNQGILSRRVSVRVNSHGEDMNNQAPPPYSEQDDFDERTPLLAGRPRQIDHWPRQQELEEQHSNAM